jgi:hypothetical protein
MTVTLTNGTGTNWTSSTVLSDILVANSDGAYAVAHVTTLNANGSSATTGYAANGGSVNQAPAPATLALAMSGLVAFGLVGLRRLRRRVAV